MSRALIKRVRPLLVDRVALSLRCTEKNVYLWSDLGLPIHAGPAPENDDTQIIDMWFSHGGDLLGVSGLTHATQVTSYNRQALKLDLPILDPDEPVPPLDFVDRPVQLLPGVLVENGPVLSGQKTLELNPFLTRLAEDFLGTRFYCTGPVPENMPTNVIDVSTMNLIDISTLRNVCSAMLTRLSGPFVASLTSRNQGRLKRLVLGEPIGCPIWDENDVEYFDAFDAMSTRLREILT